MLLQKSTEEQTEVLNEILFVILPIRIGKSNIGVQRQHLHEHGKHLKVI